MRDEQAPEPKGTPRYARFLGCDRLLAGGFKRTLDQVIEWRGKPRAIRCDNGPEYISGQILSWAEPQGIEFQYIQPGKPQQNAYVERYNRTVRYDWLNQHRFESADAGISHTVVLDI